MAAAKNGRKDVCELLLKKGADPNTEDIQGNILCQESILTKSSSLGRSRDSMLYGNTCDMITHLLI